MAGTVIRADPIAVARMGDGALRASQRIADAWRAVAGGVELPTSAFGDSAGSRAVGSSYAAVLDGSDPAIGRLVGVLEGDTDRLYRVAFAYQKADDDAAGHVAVTPV